ncbi:MAG: Uma2 family endonuclease [Polyangiales bacterium]
MGDAAPNQPLSAEDYLQWERAQPERHEYHRGEVFAMAGGSARHNYLCNAAGAELRAALRGRGCHVLSADQRISAAAGERYVYADAVVACGGVRMEPGTTDVLANPAIVVEVLSKGTASYDRGDKWDAYQRLPSLTDYLLVSQQAAAIEHYHREGDGSWRYRRLDAGATFTLHGGAPIAVDALYEGAFELPGD